MSEKFLEEAFNASMSEIHNQYISENRENEFIFNFNINYVEEINNKIVLSVASPFMKNQVVKRGSLEILSNKLKEITGLNNLEIECIVKNTSSSSPAAAVKTESKNDDEGEEKNETAEKSPVKTNIETTEKIKKHPQLNENYVFETFIPGDNSNYAYNAAIAVAKNPGNKYNPILLYGSSGLGKTHLMQSIGNYIYKQNPKLKICYVSAETFGNDFTSSLTSKKTNDFKNKYRNLDVLLLDDIHFLQGKEGMQNELFYTFEALSQKKAQMVFTCDRPIRETKILAERLVSRLSNGLCIDIQAPKYENRYAILQKKVDLMGKTLDPKIIDYIAKNIETNVRDLEAALNKVFGLEELMEQKITLENIKTQLNDLISTNKNNNISLDIIQKVIADAFQISVSDLKGKKRDKKYVTPRHIAIYIARQLTEISFTELGEEFGGRDHSTIMNACEKIEDEIKLDSSFEARIQLFIKDIKEYKK